MDVRKENIQRERFKEILFDLARSQEILKPPAERAKFYCRLEDLYYKTDNGKDFRHFYSDIFAVLTQIRSDESKGSIDILGQNLSLIRQGYQATNKDEIGNLKDISDCIKKLYDHVSLDIARINYADASDRKVSSEDKIRDVQTEVNSLSKEIKTIKTDSEKFFPSIQELKQQLSNSQKEGHALNDRSNLLCSDVGVHSVKGFLIFLKVIAKYD